MDYRHFKRNPNKVRAACKVGSDGSVIATRPSKLYFPERFLEKQLAVIGAQNYVVGIFAHVVDDTYFATFLGAAMVHVEPTAIATVKFGDDTYLELGFDPGARILVNQEVVQDGMLTYRIYDEIISKGHTPWYMSYDDLIKLLFTANDLAGVNLLANHAMLELNAAAVSRNAANMNQYYRHFIKSYEDILAHPPATIPLMSVSYGTTNTVSRIMGSYWEQGINSALVNPATKVENIERLLRT